MSADHASPPPPSAGHADHVRFLHSSDLQIGMFRWFLDHDAQSRFDAARLDALRRLGQVAEERRCEFIVLAGDTFEYNSLTARTTGRTLEVLRQIPVPVYLLPGNHDPLVADSILRTVEQAEGTGHIHLLDSGEPQIVGLSDGTTIELVGAPLMSRHAAYDVVARALEGLEPTTALRVMVGHGQVESRGDAQGIDLIDLDRVGRALDEGLIDYLALGDTHSTRRLDADGRVWFSGAPETTDFHDLREGSAGGESDSGNALVVELSRGTDDKAGDVSVTVESVRTGSWVFEALHREVTSAADIRDFLTDLRAYPDKESTVIRYSLEGTVSLAARRELETGLDELQPVFGALFPHERHMDLVVEPDEDELTDLNLGGYARDALDELVSDGESDAVNLLFRLAGKVER